MHRTDADSHVGNLFDEGDPGVPRAPTQVDAAWLNAVQEEICNLIELCGVTLVKGTNTQLATALLNRAISVTERRTFEKGIVAGGAGVDGVGVRGNGLGTDGRGVLGVQGDASPGVGVRGDAGAHASSIGVEAVARHASAIALVATRAGSDFQRVTAQVDGWIYMGSAVDPASTTTLYKTITPMLVPKCLAVFDSNNTVSPTVRKGQNLSGVSQDVSGGANGGEFTVTIGQDMADANYGEVIMVNGARFVEVVGRYTDRIVFRTRTPANAQEFAADNTGLRFTVILYGAQ